MKTNNGIKYTAKNWDGIRSDSGFRFNLNPLHHSEFWSKKKIQSASRVTREFDF